MFVSGFSLLVMLLSMGRVTAEMGSAYEASIYNPNEFTSGLSRFNRAVRFFNSADFADLFSPQRRGNIDYIYGVVFFSTLLAVIAFCWGLLLVILKCRSYETGCAGGKPFQTNYDVTQGTAVGSTLSVEYASSLESDSQDPPTLLPTFHYGDELVANRKRARRTRIVFLFFGLTALACITTFVIASFARVRMSLSSTQFTVAATQEIFDQIDSAMRSVASAGEFATSILNEVNMDATSVCPGAAASLGVDLIAFSEVAGRESEDLKIILNDNITSINETIHHIKIVKDDVVDLLNYGLRYSWAIPAIFFGMAITCTIAMLGVVLAWTGKSGKTFQAFTSFGLLPFLILFCIVCWASTIATGAGVMLIGDACLANGAPGGPDSTIIHILQQNILDQNSTVYLMAEAYTGGCRGDQSPIQELIDLDNSLEASVSKIWNEIFLVDEYGRDNLTAICGDGLVDFLDGTRQLAQSLTTIQKAIGSAVGSLDCTVINPIYTSVAHDEVCGDILYGLGLGYVLLMGISICLMILVSLRAALYHQGMTEDKVYDESEAAENMIVDEHEEYLAYISKYKHEWEEYEGFITQNADESEALAASNNSAQSSEDPDTFHDDADDDNRSYLHEDLNRRVVGRGQGGEESESEYEYESSLAESSLPDDLSFPSLLITPSIAEAAAAGPAAAFASMPALLPSTSNDDIDDEPFELHHIQILPQPLRRVASYNRSVPKTIIASQMMDDDLSLDSGGNDYQQRTIEDDGTASLLDIERLEQLGEEIEMALFVPDNEFGADEDDLEDNDMGVHYGVKSRSEQAIENERADRSDQQQSRHVEKGIRDPPQQKEDPPSRDLNHILFSWMNSRYGEATLKQAPKSPAAGAESSVPISMSYSYGSQYSV